MQRVCKSQVKQPCPGVDMYNTFGNIFIGSYPIRSNFFRKENDTTCLSNILEFLNNKYDRSLIIDLAKEENSYLIEKKYESKINYEKVYWMDYHSFPLHDFICLIYKITSFLKKGNNGVFIHCKHGKGRTGTLVCGLIMIFYNTTFEIANRKFIKDRKIYKEGVKCKAQTKLLNYWELIIGNEHIEKQFIDFKKKEPKCWILNSILIYHHNNKYNKYFHVFITNIVDNTKVGYYRDYIGKFYLNSKARIMWCMNEDICVEIQYKKKLLTKTYVTFSLNCAMEYMLNKKNEALEFDRALTVKWEQMSGINGTDIRGEKLFDKVIIYLSQSS